MKQLSSTYRMCLNEVRVGNRSGSHVNCIIIHKQNTYKHEMAKVAVCMALLNLGRDFLTEAIFNSGFRCDILDLEQGVCYEILETETMEEFEKKKNNYPECLLLIPLKAEDVIKGDFEL